MNNAVIIGAVAVAIGVGGYVWYNGQQADMAKPEPAIAEKPAETAQPSTPAEPAQTVVEKAAVDAMKAAEGAKEAAEAAVNEARDEVDQAVETAREPVEEAASDAVNTVMSATDDAADATATQTNPALTPDGFDAGQVRALIDASGLDDLNKTVLKTAVDQASADPALVSDVIAQVKTALGL